MKTLEAQPVTCAIALENPPRRRPFAVRGLLLLAILAGFLSSTEVTGAEPASEVAAAKSLFARPTREYFSAPLWVWNDRLTEDQIISTLRDLAGQSVKQVFVHPRPGLMTPYLSEEWFRLWKTALREAERLDMNVWIYDENSYPSGFAGGWVPEVMPESRGRGLALREVKQPPAWSNDLIGVYRLEERSFEQVTDQVRKGETLPEGKYLVAAMVRAANSPWHGNRSYVDLLYPGVTEKFIEITLEAYRREIGDQFGRRVPGVFTDEPELRPTSGLPWTDSLPERFEQRWGYRLTDHLPSLKLLVGDWQRVRHNYYQLLLELFIERWARPLHDYCEKNHLEFTGHYWDHEWPQCRAVPDNMAMYAWHQRPAIDVLMNQYREDTHAQFGNARMVRELASVANQMGYRRTLCEAYGAGGWDLRFEDMKRIGDWLYVLGVNTLDEHLSYITLRGARKRDHPQSFSYHEPWWSAYHVSAQYFGRLSAALSQGQQVNSVLVLEPTTTAWLYNSDPGNDPSLTAIGNTFQDLLINLERAQAEYDLGCEDILARHGSVKNGELIVGQRAYRLVILPPHTENLNGPTWDLLGEYLKQGGAIWGCDEPPVRRDGSPTTQGRKLALSSSWRAMAAAAVPEALRQQQQRHSGFAVDRDAGDPGILFHHRRQLADGELLFLANSSLESRSHGRILSPGRGLEQWDLDRGAARPYPFRTSETGIEASFDLPPGGSLLLCLTKASRPAVEMKSETVVFHSAVDAPKIRRAEPNVLVLDYVDITAGGETRKNQHFYRANQMAFQKNGMERNPWDSAVQFKDELIRKTFAADSGFEATYRFQIEGALPGMLELVIERPDLYQITCNGQPLKARPGSWWLDKAFGRLDLAGVARVGDNEILLQARPFTIYHELEPVYVLGNFNLKPTSHGFVIVPESSLRPGPWNEQGLPLYSAWVTDQQTFDLPDVEGRFRVVLPRWYGSVAQVSVNGKPAGYVTSQPWETELLEPLKPGVNRVDVSVCGTLKNTLGPHHNNPGLGSAWPGMFQTGPDNGPPPGAQYATVGYGLFEPFLLKQVK